MKRKACAPPPWYENRRGAMPNWVSGFSLIEVLVAIGIIGMMAVATGALLERIPVNGKEIHDQDVALRVARNELEILRASGYAALPASGPFTDTLLDSLSSGAASVTVTDLNEKTKQAEVLVSWTGAGAVARSVTLTTLITQDSGL